MTPSLYKMACRAAIRNADSIDDLGDEITYEMALPILRRVQDPDQLMKIEQNSPQIADQTGELWRKFIERDIQRWKEKIIEPKNPASWSKVYRKLKKQDEAERLAAEEALKQALNARKAEKESHSANIVRAVIPQGKKAASRSWGASRPMAMGGQAIKRTTGVEALATIRRQSAHASASRNVTAAVPSHELQNKRSAIAHAPASMLNAYARQNGASPARNPAVGSGTGLLPQAARRAPVFVPRAGPRSLGDQAIDLALRNERREKEERLRALTAKKAGPAGAGVGGKASGAAAGMRTGTETGAGAGATSSPQRPAASQPPPMQRKRPAGGNIFMDNKRARR